MDVQPAPTADEARAGLANISAARHAAAMATRRPAWVDLGLAATIGLAIGLGAAGLMLACLAVTLLGSLAFTSAQRRLARSHGQLFDRSAVGARSLRLLVLLAGVAALILLGPDEWQPWYSFAVGACAAAGAFGWLRWEDRYRVQRLAAGNYHPDQQL